MSRARWADDATGLQARRSVRVLFAFYTALCLVACSASAPTHPVTGAGAASTGDADDLLICDCLLPGKIRKLGGKITYLTPRRPVRTTASECEIRGGEYTAYDRADYRTSLRIWNEAAEGGDAAAQNNMGEIYERGLGTSPNYELAAAWYRKAAEQEYARAQVNLGQLYDRGLGVPHDPQQAVAWYSRASGLVGGKVPFVPAAPAPELDPALLAELELRSREAQRLHGEVDSLRQALRESEQKAQAAGAPDPALEAQRRAQEAAIRELDAKLRAAQGKIVTLEKELAEEGRPLDEVPVAGPSIELIEPPVPATRGLAVVASKTGAPRLVIGRVDAPAGIMAVTMNDDPILSDTRGFFKHQIEVPLDGTRVKVIAVDRQGKRAQREFQLAAQATRPPPLAKTKISYGRYVALVIGNDDYRTLSDLQTATADARSVGELLNERYGFDVQVLQNATRYQILSALNQLRATLTKEDNLLIYYAGHGEFDRVNGRGHWLPVDAEATNTANWISNISISDILNAMGAKHVLVVADSCYSGSLTRSALARLEAGMTKKARDSWIRAMVGKRSRTALTSGGLEPVVDNVGGHSIFARVLLEVLKQNRDVIEGQRLFSQVAARVTYAAAGTNFQQVPQYAPIKFAGHESGEFFFVPRGS